MTWTTRALLILLTVMVATLAPAPISRTHNASALGQGPDLLRDDIDERPALQEPTALTFDEAALVAGGYALFEAAQLKLPADLVISFHRSLYPCDEAFGLFTVEHSAPRVRVCFTHSDPYVEVRIREQTLVHELAHVWVYMNFDESIRPAFVQLSDSDSWNEPSSRWQGRGTERAADLITWAVLDPDVLYVDFDVSSCPRWSQAYELLTAQAAPPHLAACASTGSPPLRR